MIAPVLLAAAEKSQPLIDIDGTVFIQFAIFLVMMGVLHWFVFKPYLKVQAERTRRIDGARADAQAMQERAASMLADYEQRFVAARQRGAEERARIQAEGRAYERDVLAQAREAGQRAFAAAQERVRSERETARARLLGESQALAQQVASRILDRKVA